MESRILRVYDYHQVDISELAKPFCIDEDQIQAEISRVQNRFAKWEADTTVHLGDIATCRLQSAAARFNKEKAEILVGNHLLDENLEQSMVGMKAGETKTVEIGGITVTVQVQSIMSKRTTPFDDEMASRLEIAGVTTAAAYREYLIEQQRQAYLEKIEFPAINHIIKEVIHNSDLLIKKKDWADAVSMELNRCRAISRSQGYELESMTAKDFEGKIPVQSYHELVAMVQTDTWERLAQYLFGEYYANQENYHPTETEYERFLKEYSATWHDTLEQAKEITPYSSYCFLEYVNFFYDKLKKYVEKKLLQNSIPDSGKQKEDTSLAIQYATDENLTKLLQEDFVIADFYSETCGPCKIFAKILEDMTYEIPFLKIVKVNTTKYPALGDEYKVQAVPTLLFYKDGTEITRHIGLMRLDELKKAIAQYLY